MPKQELSAAAQKLVEFCPIDSRGEIGDVAAVITAHPELMSGLNEYIEYARETGEQIAKSKATPAAAHKIAQVIRKASALKLKPKPRQ